MADIRTPLLNYKPSILTLANLARARLHVAVRPALLRLRGALVAEALGQADRVPAVAVADAVAEARDREAPVHAHADAAGPAVLDTPHVVARVLLALVVPPGVLAVRGAAVGAVDASPGAVRDGLPDLLVCAVQDVAGRARLLAPPVGGLQTRGAGHIGSDGEAGEHGSSGKQKFHVDVKRSREKKDFG